MEGLVPDEGKIFPKPRTTQQMAKSQWLTITKFPSTFHSKTKTPYRSHCDVTVAVVPMGTTVVAMGCWHRA